MKKKNFIILLALILNFILFDCCSVFATQSTDKIVLSDDKITVNGEGISENSNEDIFLSKEMDNGGPSEEAKNANIKIDNIINIKKSGTYEFTGTLSDGQIAIDTNNINGEVIILLNNVDITCKNAPAIFVYNTETDSEVCKVIIKTSENSENYISGGLIKQSVEGWIDQDKIIYNIEKNYNDEGKYFERYKYDGAISSDISLTFEGKGILTIASQREGIEVKRDITINSGNYIINSKEDGINAAQDNESVITINGGTIVIRTSKDAEQGDGIDSNGYLYINGGEIFAFSNPLSADSGLDSDLGIYINGGQIVAIGNMYDEIKEDSKQNSITLQFNEKMTEGTLITLVDEDENPIIAFECDRDYKVITLSKSDLEDKIYVVYKGGKIEGTKVNGLYTNITSYTKGTEVEANLLNKNSRFNEKREFDFINQQNKNINWYLIGALSVIAIACLIISIILIIKNKGKIVVFLLGIIIGVISAIIITTVFSNRFINQQNIPMDNKNFENERLKNLSDNFEINKQSLPERPKNI